MAGPAENGRADVAASEVSEMTLHPATSIHTAWIQRAPSHASMGVSDYAALVVGAFLGLALGLVMVARVINGRQRQWQS